MKPKTIGFIMVPVVLAMFCLVTNSALAGSMIAHDTEYYILEAQHGEQWAQDDKTVDAKLAAFRAGNDGKPPNILYILVNDIGFGDLAHLCRLN